MGVQVEKWPLIIHSFFLFLIQVIPTITQPTYFHHICDDNTVLANSKYQTNINNVFHSSSNYSTGFYATVPGNGTSDVVVYGVYLCRGNHNATGCRDCIITATTIDLPKKYCPNRREALIWYDECMVRYSDDLLLGKRNTDPEICINNQHEVDTNQTRFMELTGEIMKDVMDRAAQGDRFGRKFVTEKANYTSSEKLYALAQCTPDLRGDDCMRCLRTAIGQISNLNVQGARLMQPSCNIRYDNLSFFYGADDSPELQIPPPPPSSTTGNSTISGFYNTNIHDRPAAIFNATRKAQVSNSLKLKEAKLLSSDHDFRYSDHFMYGFWKNISHLNASVGVDALDTEENYWGDMYRSGSLTEETELIERHSNSKLGSATNEVNVKEPRRHSLKTWKLALIVILPTVGVVLLVLFGRCFILHHRQEKRVQKVDINEIRLLNHYSSASTP